MCLTDVPANRVPFPKPAGYDPRRYEIFLRYVEAGWSDVLGNHAAMPNRKSDTNNHGAFSTDDIGMNYDYPEADYAHAGKDRRRAPRLPTGADVDDGQQSPRAGRTARSGSRNGAWPRTSSPTTAIGRTSFTSARPGGWSPTT